MAFKVLEVKIGDMPLKTDVWSKCTVCESQSLARELNSSVLSGFDKYAMSCLGERARLSGSTCQLSWKENTNRGSQVLGAISVSVLSTSICLRKVMQDPSGRIGLNRITVYNPQ